MVAEFNKQRNSGFIVGNRPFGDTVPNSTHSRLQWSSRALTLACFLGMLGSAAVRAGGVESRGAYDRDYVTCNVFDVSQANGREMSGGGAALPKIKGEVVSTFSLTEAEYAENRELNSRPRQTAQGRGDLGEQHLLFSHPVDVGGTGLVTNFWFAVLGGESPESVVYRVTMTCYDHFSAKDFPQFNTPAAKKLRIFNQVPCGQLQSDSQNFNGTLSLKGRGEKIVVECSVQVGTSL